MGSIEIEVAAWPSTSTTERGRILERFAKRFLETQNYKVEKEVKFTASEVDLLATEITTGDRIFVECKAYRSPISSEILMKLLGNISFKEYSAGWLISTFDLGKEAKGFQDEWNARPSEKKRQLQIYTPHSLSDRLIRANIVADPMRLDIRPGADPHSGPSATLILTETAEFWIRAVVNVSGELSAILYDARSGKRITDKGILEHIYETDISKKLPWMEFESEPSDGSSDDQERLSKEYLELLVKLNSSLEMPGRIPAVPIESIWLKPRLEADGETHLWKLLKDGNAIVVEAPAGFGKTVFSRFFSNVLAKDSLNIPCPGSDSWQSKYFGVNKGAGPSFPIFIDLRRMVQGGGIEALFNAAVPAITVDWRDVFQPLLKDGKVVFILDGFDEALMPTQELASTLMRAQKEWTTCIFIVTARRGAAKDLIRAGFMRAELMRPDHKMAMMLLDQWASALLSDDRKKVFIERTHEYLRRSKTLTELITLPLCNFLICINFALTGNLPGSKALLFSSLVNWLLSSRSRIREANEVSEADTKLVLQAAASAMLSFQKVESRARSDFGRLTEALATLLPEIPSVSIERIIRSETSLGDCVIDEHGHVSFWHASLRDYFAAEWILRRHAESGKLAEELERLSLDPAWQESDELAIGILAAEGSYRVREVLAELDPATALNLPHQIRLGALRLRLLEVAMDHGFRPEAGFEASLRDSFKNAMALSDEQLSKIDPAERVSSFLVLGALRLDSRLSGKPATRAVPLPIVDAQTHETTQLHMGRYPVTVQEYNRFLEKGIEDIRWLDKDKAHPPRNWSEQQLYPNTPVVGVTWHQARAYCAWLTSEMDGKVLARLPSEKEFTSACYALAEIAADGRRLFRSTVSSQLVPRTPIGLYPERRGPHGHDDLAGLIWEWLGPARRFGRGRRRAQVTLGVFSDGFPPRVYRRKASANQASNIVGFRLVLERI